MNEKNQPKTENLSFRVSLKTKELFHELFDQCNAKSKSELLEIFLANHTNKPEPVLDEKPEVDQVITKEVIEDGEIVKINKEEVIDDEVPEVNQNDLTEITLILNPIQLFAILETISSLRFIEDTNDLVNKVDNGIDNSFWGNDLYSGEFAGLFKEMNPDTESNESINQNVSAALVNLFMMQLTHGAADYLEGPVTKRVLKEYIKEQELD